MIEPRKDKLMIIINWQVDILLNLQLFAQVLRMDGFSFKVFILGIRILRSEVRWKCELWAIHLKYIIDFYIGFQSWETWN